MPLVVNFVKYNINKFNQYRTYTLILLARQGKIMEFREIDRLISPLAAVSASICVTSAARALVLLRLGSE